VSTDIGGDIRLAIWASNPEWSPFTEPAPKARLQAGHHTVRATGGSLNYVVPERSDEPFAGLERHPATTFARDLSQKSGPGRARSPDSKTYGRGCVASVIEISDTGRR
jgi:hypothetical protein